MNFKKIHFVGIGGIGMSALAKLLLRQGCEISGSDLKNSSITENLKRLGAQIFLGHNGKNVKDSTQLVVYSSAVSLDNPELIKARERGIPIMHRGDLLAWLMESKIGIAISGTHGKTTTSALIAQILLKADLEPTIVLGGEVGSWGGNAYLGEGDFFVAEADESDGSFLKLPYSYCVVTNIEPEHLDYYQRLEDIVKNFQKFMANTDESGCVIYNSGDPNIRGIIPRFSHRCISFGLSSRADIYSKNISFGENRIEFDCIYLGEELGRVYLNIPGRHNILNVLAAIALAKELNIKFKKVQEALSLFEPAARRFQIKREGTVMVVDDYAHHPTEIRVTLEAARTWKGRRIVTVFQPHRYSRLFHLMDHFIGSFSLTDELIITDIYSAGESPIPRVSAEKLYIHLKSNIKTKVRYLAKHRILSYLLKNLKENDMVLILGAGDITHLADELVERLDAGEIS